MFSFSEIFSASIYRASDYVNKLSYMYLWFKIKLALFRSTGNSGRLSVQAYTEIIKTISVFTNSLMKWESFFSPSRRRIRIIISYSYSCRQAGANDVRLLNNDDVGLFIKEHVDKTKTGITCMCTYIQYNLSKTTTLKMTQNWFTISHREFGCNRI